MNRLIAVGLVGFAVVAGGIVGTSASAAPKVKTPVVTTTTATEVPDPTPTWTPKPVYTVPSCWVDGQPEPC